jgi:hypothetical protein
VSSGGYRLLGWAVWHGGKWYLRRRLPSRRKLALISLGALVAGGAVVVVVRGARG